MAEEAEEGPFRRADHAVEKGGLLLEDPVYIGADGPDQKGDEHGDNRYLRPA